jgi:hypothetical protein
MSPNTALLLYLLLEHGSLQNGNGVLFRPLCDEGRLHPPPVSEVLAQHAETGSARIEQRRQEERYETAAKLAIDFPAPGSDSFTLYAALDHFSTRGLNVESCFGSSTSRLAGHVRRPA